MNPFHQQLAPLETLIRLEAGYKAELNVLRESSERDVSDDAREPYVFSLDDAQLEPLKKCREVLKEELAISTARLKSRMKLVRLAIATELERTKLSAEKDAVTEESEEMLRKELISLRRKTLVFAKEQWPLSQDAEQFEGGDFWEACVAACSDPQEFIEYSAQETPFAELLLQTGVVERAEDSAGMKRIKITKELFDYETNE
jgi:hypothetical protein